jgi:FkbM family methyltransferase
MRSPIGSTVAVPALRLAYKRLGRTHRWHARTYWGQRMEVRLPETMSEELVRFGLIEPDLTAYVLALLRPGQIFIDVGAHYGYYCLLGARLVGPRGRVYAFEPTPSSRQVLTTNTTSISTVSVSACAVWSGTGQVTLRDFGTRLSRFNSMFSPRFAGELPDWRSLTVSAVSLDEFCTHNNLRPDLVKIDAESAESHIVAGMKRLLGEERVPVTIEVGDEGVEGVPTSAELLSSVLDYGYVAVEYRGGELHLHQLRDRYRYENILLLPREHPLGSRLRAPAPRADVTW